MNFTNKRVLIWSCCLLVIAGGGYIYNYYKNVNAHVVINVRTPYVQAYIKYLNGLNMNIFFTKATDNQLRAREDELWDKVDMPIKNETSALLLKDIYYACEEQSLIFTNNHSGNFCVRDPFFIAKCAILFRLAEIKTEDSAKVLATFASDKKLHFDGELALRLDNAITACGKPCLPYLQAIRPKTESINELINMIEAGQIDGP